MKNLKKTLAVVLAFAMVLSMGFSAFAYTDVAEGTKVAEAVGILSNLNIFTGFEDGTFKPNDTVTRAQMAAIICRTLGYEDQATASTGTTNFYDVPASHWASGYINVAESLQIVNGYGNGAFGPEDQVTYEQAIKMIVVALGYELDAQAKGGWSTGYLAVAAREGITKNSNGVVGAPAARGTIAVLVYNSLEVPLMDQDVWTPSGKEDEYTKLAETILSRYLDVTKIEAVVAAVPYATFANTGYTADSDLKVTFEGEGAKYYGFSGKTYKALSFWGEEDTPEDLEYDATYVPEINNMAGKKVVAYVGNDEDEELGAHAVYAVAEKQGANKVTVLSATQLTANDDDELVIEYREVGSKAKKTLDLAAAIEPAINFGRETSAEISNTAELAALVEDGGIITLISNDANSKIDKIFITKYSAEAVIEEVSEEDGLISFESFAGTDEILDIDTEDEDVLYIVIKDGAVATVADIAANDTVSVVGGENGFFDETFNLYYVSSKTVTGKVDEYSASDVTIAGEDYEWSPLSIYESSDDLAKKEGIFFLNVDGQIAYADATADKNYGIVIAAGAEGRKNMIEVVLADGTSAIYELADKAKFGEATTDDAVIEALDDDYLNEESNGWAAAAEADITNLVFNITIKDGKVKELAHEAAVAEDVTGRDYDEENMEYGALSFNDSTVVISLADIEAGAAVEASDIKVGKVADFFVDGEGSDFVLTAYDYDSNDVAGLVIGTGLTSAIAQDSAAVIVTGYRTKLVDDEEAFVISGFQDGKAVSYTILGEDVATDAEVTDFAKGNIILVGAANAEGMITDYEVLYARAGGLKSDIADKEDEYYYFGALDYTLDDPETEDDDETANLPTASKFYLADVDEEVDAAGNAFATVCEDGAVTMRNAARYTLVDFSKVEDLEEDDIEVSKKSKGTGLFSRYADKYDYTVFVRYFDDTQVEVIVFRDAQ